MSPNNKTGFLDYLNEASQTVSNWPNWKKDGSDATRFQSPSQKDGQINRKPTSVIYKKS